MTVYLQADKAHLRSAAGFYSPTPFKSLLSL